MRLAPLALSLMLLAVAGCVSAKGAYEDGIALEQSGDMAGAAEAYIRALNRDSSLPNARERLEVAGAEAIARDLAAAATSGPAQAAEHYLSADALIQKAAEVGVDLYRPASFEADLEIALDQAVAGALQASQQSLDRGDYEQSIRFVDTGRRYRPSAQQAAELDAIAGNAYVGWAEVDLAAGRYRSALRRADAALSLGASGLAGTVDALRAEILEAGTVRLAVFPAERARGADRFPRGFIRDLSDVLLDEAFATPQPFLQTPYPADVRRLVREERNIDERYENPRLLSDLARDLGADLGVAIDVHTLSLTTEERRRRTITSRWRGDGERGAPPTWDRVNLRLTAEVDASYIVVDANSRRAVCEDDVRERVRGTYDIAESQHDEDELRLDSRDRDLFHPDWEADEQDRILVDLHHELADAIARGASACALRQVP
ncbi:MAG: hypothetical protein AAF170_14425 [Bacteroidota bacterium]